MLGTAGCIGVSHDVGLWRGRAGCGPPPRPYGPTKHDAAGTRLWSCLRAVGAALAAARPCGPRRNVETADAPRCGAVLHDCRASQLSGTGVTGGGRGQAPPLRRGEHGECDQGRGTLDANWVPGRLGLDEGTLDLEFGNPLRYRAADYSGIAILRLPAEPSPTHLEKAVRTLIAPTKIVRHLWISYVF